MSDVIPSENNKIPFHLTFSIDRKGFFRRTCPSCGRDFKTQVSDADFASSLQPTITRLEAEIGERFQPETHQTVTEYLYCPYCQHHAEASEMLTETFSAYLKRQLMREYVLPKGYQALKDAVDLFQGLNQNRSQRLFSISITSKYEQPMLPTQPISGPEPPDMTIVELLCCGKKVKVLDGWMGIERCPYCGTWVTLQ